VADDVASREIRPEAYRVAGTHTVLDDRLGFWEILRGAR